MEDEHFIEVAGEVNSEMPAYWVRKVTEALNDQSKAVRGSNVLVVGVAYKKDVDARACSSARSCCRYGSAGVSDVKGRWPRRRIPPQTPAASSPAWGTDRLPLHDRERA